MTGDTVPMDTHMSGLEVRRVLGISKPLFLRLVNSGELDAIKVGGHFKVSERSLRAYMDRNRVRQAPAS